MSLLRAAACWPVLFIISCGVTKPYQSDRPQFRERDASFFIVSEKKMSSWDKAKAQCPQICQEEGGYWTGAWSGQSPLELDSGTCECSSAASQAVAKPEVMAAQPAMSMEEMQAAFDVPAAPSQKTAEAPSKTSASSPNSNSGSVSIGSKSSSSAGSTKTASSSVSSDGEVSATVERDPKTGTVTATAQAGRAKAQSRSVPSGEVSATITRDPKTGTVTASASAGNATSTATSRKDPFDF